MSIEELEQNLRDIIKDRDEHTLAQAKEILLTYRQDGGAGKAAYETIWQLWVEYEEIDELKQDVFGDLLSLIQGYCSSNQEIHFSDLSTTDFDSFNSEIGKFLA